MPAQPRWLLAVPDAIAQLEELDREWLTRRDLETLFGISKPRAAVLMRTFGAERLGNVRMLARTQLLRHLRARKKSAAYSGAVDRRERLITALRRARITGIRVPVAASVLSVKLAGLPEGVTVERGRIEVRFDGAREAVGRLFALAQALVNDFDRFEDRVGRGGGASA
jgi:hypothetical protein